MSSNFLIQKNELDAYYLIMDYIRKPNPTILQVIIKLVKHKPELRII